jgi:hypothetical protein
LYALLQQLILNDLTILGDFSDGAQNSMWLYKIFPLQNAVILHLVSLKLLNLQMITFGSKTDTILNANLQGRKPWGIRPHQILGR